MSCLFDSLTVLLQDELRNYNINCIRSYVTDYMKTNLKSNLCNEDLEEWIKMISEDKYGNIDINKYISEMDKHSTWGGGPEIAVISKMFNVIIAVHRNNAIVSEFNCCKSEAPKKKLHLHWTGGHYTPMYFDNL